MSDQISLREGDTLYVKKRGGGERAILPHKWWINRDTPVGEDADLWERKPNSGRKYIPWKDVIRVESTKPSKHEGCGGRSSCRNSPIEDHTCPYAYDINGDSTSLCNCCAECQDECAMDI